MFDGLLKFLVFVLVLLFTLVLLIGVLPLLLLCLVIGGITLIFNLIYIGIMFVVKCFKNLFKHE